MSRIDPYAEFQKPAQSDPYAEFQAPADLPAGPEELAKKRASLEQSTKAIESARTPFTALREGAIGFLEPFDLHNAPQVIESVVNLVKDAMLGRARPVAEAAGEMVKAPFRPIGSLAAGIREGDINKAAYGLGGVASQTVPAVYGARATLQGMRSAMRPPVPAAEQLYERALNIRGKGVPPAETRAMVTTGLKEGIPINEAGVTKLGDLIKELGEKVDVRIAQDPEATISPVRMAQQAAGRTAAEVEMQALPEADLATVERGRQEFLRRHSREVERPAGTEEVPTGLVDQYGKPITRTKPRTETVREEVPIPAPQGQAIKKGTYKQLQEKAYTKEQTSAQVKLEKALAHEAMQQLNELFPEIKDINVRTGQAIDLQPHLESAVNTWANSKTGLFKRAVLGTAGTLITGSSSLGFGSAFLGNILDNPGVASRVAIAIYKAHQGTPQPIGMSEAMARVTAASNALKQTAQQNERRMLPSH